MKQFVKSISFFAVVAMAAVSCAKTEQDKTTFTHRVYINVDEPVKTSIVESGDQATFIWSADDASRFTIKENSVEGTDIVLTPSNGYQKMTLAASFATESSSSYTYTALLAVTKTASGKPRVATIQTSDGTSYDPNADVLIAKPQTFDAIQSSLNMQFMRPVVIAKMTLKGLNGGETVQSVKLTSDKNITGYYEVDSSEWSGDGKEITINTNQVVPSSGDNAGNITVYFVTMPVENATLSVTVTTAETIYSKTFARAITFTLGEEKAFGVSGMSSTPNSSLAGYYLIGCYYNNDSWKLMNPDINTSGQNHYYPDFSTSVTTAPSTVDFDTDFAGISNINKYIWQVEEYDGQYSIKSLDSGDYLSYSGSANAAQAASSLSIATKFKISVDGSKVATIESCNVEGRKLKYNYNSGTNPRFACYTSAQNSLVLIPVIVDNREVISLSFAQSVIEKTTANYNGFTGQTVSATDSNDDDITGSITVTYEKESDSNNVVTSLDSSTGAVVLSGNTGSATITASFAGDTNYRPAAAASYTITVASPGVVYYKKVTSAPSDWSGHYLIVYESSSTEGYVLTGVSGEIGQYAAVTISASGIVASDYSSYDIEVAQSGSSYTMKMGSNYLAYTSTSTSGNNKLYTVANASANGALWTLSVNDAQNVYNTSRYLRWNNTSGQYRFCCYTSGQQHISFFQLEDSREDPGMSWSVADASASWNTGNTASGFSAPTLTPGNATGITYESTDTAVATVNSAGAVTIVGPGETTIKAIFAGDATYQAQTVSYVLTVTDNRETVATPVISPDASSTVPSGTEVTITCSTSGATIYYTLDNSAPDSNSSTYSGAITLTESKVVKAIAIKNGYKDSSVATANYTVGVVNTSTEADPYSAAEADALTGQLAANGTLADVYVSGIISEITTAYNSTYGNVSFNISADGLTTSTQFLIFRAAATSADDFKVGDAVEFKGTLKNYYANDTYTREMDAAATLIYQVHAPSFTPNGGSFTTSQSVTISADSGATIRYTDDGSTNPTASTGSVYSGALNLTATTTIKAIAIKDGHVTGVVSKTFTKGSGGGNVYSKYSGTLTEGDYIIYYDGKAMNNTISSDRLQYLEVTPSNDQITNPDASIVWHIAASGDYWTIYSANAGKYAASTGAKNKAALNSSGTDNKSLWSVSGTSTYDFVNKQNTTNNVNAYLRNNGTYGFACYASSTGGGLTLYKKN